MVAASPALEPPSRAPLRAQGSQRRVSLSGAHGSRDGDHDGRRAAGQRPFPERWPRARTAAIDWGFFERANNGRLATLAAAKHGLGVPFFLLRERAAPATPPSPRPMISSVWGSRIASLRGAWIRLRAGSFADSLAWVPCRPGYCPPLRQGSRRRDVRGGLGRARPRGR